MWRYDLLYIVGIYIVVPTIENYIAIPSAEDHAAILSTKDCFIMLLFLLFMLLNVVPCKLYSKISFTYMLFNDLPYTCYLKICVIHCI